MSPERARRVLMAAMETLASGADLLRDLDAAVGDGDLGLTVAKGAGAVRGALGEMQAPDAPGLLAATGKAFSQANPSTMAALTGAACTSAARALAGCEALDREAAVRLVRAAADAVARRGKAEVGDKTVLDPLAASLEALESSSDVDGYEALVRMVEAAAEAVEATAGLVARRGRPSWVGERGAGQRDPGAVSYLMFLRALQSAWCEAAGPAELPSDSGAARVYPDGNP
ncbi:MAG: DAK2 domain-containing protein [Actinomycetota bacterium]|nr:DAK2 domain-containing protein [Actinomycetota bacterium]